MKKYYKDFYGSTASVESSNNGYRLKIATSQGNKVYDKILKTEKSCKLVMSRYSDGTMNEIAT